MTPLSILRGVCSSYLMFCLFLVAPVNAESPASDENVAVSAGSAVSLEYTLTLDDQSVLESNVGKEPMTCVQGAHEIVPGLEAALEGMKWGSVSTSPLPRWTATDRLIREGYKR